MSGIVLTRMKPEDMQVIKVEPYRERTVPMSVIEDIKAEIEDYFAGEYEYCKDIPPYKTLIFEMGHKVIDIIEKHTKGDTDANRN